MPMLMMPAHFPHRAFQPLTQQRLWPPPITTSTSGPATRIASRFRPTTARTVTARAPRAASCRLSDCGSAPAPRAGRISDSRDSADRTRAGNRRRCRCSCGQSPSALLRALQIADAARDGGMIDLARRHQAQQRPCRLRRDGGRGLIASVVELVAVAVLAPAAVRVLDRDQPVGGALRSSASSAAMPAAFRPASADQVP